MKWHGRSQMNMFKRISAMAAVFTAVAFPSLALGAKPPNVILIVTDDQGYGDISALGSPILHTPHLDRLHDEAVRFSDFHVDPTCAPTRAALMTGRYAHRVRAWHTIAGGNHLRETEVTMAEVFKASGYRTAMFGKWHLGANSPYRPIDRGFEQWLGQGDGGTGTTDDYFTNDRVNDHYWHNGEREYRKGWAPDVFFDGAIDYIEAYDDKSPFFLYIATYVPHSPHTLPDPSWLKKYEGRVPPGVACFYASIEHVDQNIGRLRKVLEETGHAENTILLFMTDNGGTAGTTVFNAGMRGKKGSPYDGGHRVPFFFHWPTGGIRHGQDVSDLTAHIDVLPTLMDVCGLTPARTIDFDGRSFKQQLYKPAMALPERTLFVERQRTTEPKKWDGAVAMDNRWRLVDGKELYRMETDPGQTKNVIEQYPEVASRLRRDFDAYWKRVSPGDRDYPRPVIGTAHDIETFLHSSEWRDGTQWNHAQVAAGGQGDGIWYVKINTAATYRFEIRRWPREADAPIRGVPQFRKTVDAWDTKGGKDKLIYGNKMTALPVDAIRLRIDSFSETKPVKTTARCVLFDVPIKPGETEVNATMLDGEGNEISGAYYVYVRKLK